MNTRSRLRPAGRVNGLLLFAGSVVVLLLVIVVGANVFLSRRIPEVPNADSAGAATPVAVPPGARPASAPPTPEAAPPQVAANGRAARTPVAFEPPPERDLPDGEYGKVVRFGEQLFLDTARAAPRYVGNDLTCGNCHLDAGRQPGSAPFWASFIHYPAYRNKTRQVDTLASRIQGCFQYSMNGKAPPADDPVITALQRNAGARRRHEVAAQALAAGENRSKPYSTPTTSRAATGPVTGCRMKATTGTTSSR